MRDRYISSTPLRIIIGKYIDEVANLDDVDISRLMELADACHATPVQIIAAIVHDVLEDDAVAHGEPVVHLTLQ